jgi:hypothetical protein
VVSSSLGNSVDIKDLDSEVIEPAAAKNADDIKKDSGFGVFKHLQKGNAGHANFVEGVKCASRRAASTVKLEFVGNQLVAVPVNRDAKQEYLCPA